MGISGWEIESLQKFAEIIIQEWTLCNYLSFSGAENGLQMLTFIVFTLF